MDTCKNLAEYILANRAEAIEASLVRYFRENHLYADEEEYANPEKYGFSIKINVENFKALYFKVQKGQENYNKKVDLDIRIDCIIEVTDIVGNEPETNIFSDTYTIRIVALLDDGLKETLIYDVKYGSHLRDYKEENSLSEFLIPYISAEQYNQYVHDFLEEFYPEALLIPAFINPITLMDRMGLSIRFAKLDEGIDGKFLFTNEYETILDVIESKTFRRMLVKKNTVLIDISNIVKGRGNLINTVVHECLHWWLHKKYFELQMLLNPADPSSQVYVDEMEMPDRKKFENKYYMELQARSLSPMVMMPVETAPNCYERILSALESRKGNKSNTDIYIDSLYKFAEVYGASPSCARIRLENLGFTEVAFLSKIGSKLNVKPFKSSKRLERGQTYILEFSEAVKAFSKNINAKRAMASGKILYANGLFVINDEKYVTFDNEKGATLTELALSDVSKCCVLFETRNEGTSIAFNPKTFNFSTFCSGGSKTKYKTINTVSESEENHYLLDLKRSSIRQREEIEEARDIVSKMNRFDSFHEKLNCLLGNECLGCSSNQSIGDACGMNRDTISDYRSGKQKPDESRTIALCAGLRLHPLVSSTLLKARGIDIYTLTEDPYPFYVGLMTTSYMEGRECWNKRIEAAYPGHMEYLL